MEDEEIVTTQQVKGKISRSFKEMIMNMGSKSVVFVVLVLLVLAAAVAVYITMHASVIGEGVGEINGKIVGTAIGSARGITQGIESGAEDGEIKGLSAEDTIADVKGTMEAIGKLEVFSADVTLKYRIEIANVYKGLYRSSGDAVFIVDLSNAEISCSKDGADIYIRIPSPNVELYQDQSSTQKLVEMQKFSLSVSAEDGLNAYFNSFDKIKENSEESISNYESLSEIAKESAKKQVGQLVTALCGKSKSVRVEFK